MTETLPEGVNHHKVEIMVDDDDNMYLVDPMGNIRKVTLGGGGEGLQYATGTYGDPNVGDYIEVQFTGSPGFHNDWNAYFHQEIDGARSAQLQLVGIHAVWTNANFDTEALELQAENDHNEGTARALDIRAFQSAAVDETSSGTALGVGIMADASAGSNGTGIGLVVDAAASGDGVAIGILTHKPIAFHVGGTTPIDHVELYARDNGGGSYTLVAKVGGTEVDLVTE